VTRNDELTRRIRAATPIWNVNSTAENFLEIMLKHRPALEQSIRRTVRDREDLRRMLARLPVVDHVFPSGANFILSRLRLPAAGAADLAARLAEKRLVHVKDVSSKFTDGHGYWRVAVRTPADHDALREAVLALAPTRFPVSTERLLEPLAAV
jgi:histidinol-phosphate/aromatic aminotransferase/cobyric acid decarboxylase-like protein